MSIKTEMKVNVLDSRQKRVTLNLGDREFEVIIFETRYRYRVEQSRKYMETYFVSLISASKRILKLLTERSLIYNEKSFI